MRPEREAHEARIRTKQRVFRVFSTLDHRHRLMTFAGILTGVSEAKSEKEFTMDVACNGSTLALNPADPVDPPLSRGDVAVVTGRIFPEGTLPSGVTTSDPEKLLINSLVPMKQSATMLRQAQHEREIVCIFSVLLRSP